MNASAAKPLVEFVEGDTPRIEVFAAQKRSTPVSRRLYGQFAEHLGVNVYNGMWAQLLENTGFEPWEYFTHGDVEDMKGRLGWREYSTGVAGLVEGFKHGTACYWGAHGDGDVSYSASTDRVNSDQSQRIEIRSLKTPEVGVRQPIFLPTHRTADYEVGIWVKGTCKSLRIAVRTKEGKDLGGAELTDLTPQWKHHEVRFSIDRKGVAQEQALLLTIGAEEPGEVYLDQCFLFPADHVKGFDPDIVRMCRDARLPLLRFPGGNFVSGYHWKDGIGPADKRPIRRNPAWSRDECNHVGTDKWLTFCALVGCEPLICVNAGDGTASEAADWVEYCNGDSSTEYGALRAKNGHPDPYGVKLWEVGNELWGGWQIGHCTAEEYAKRYAEFAKAMKARDPGIHLIANGQNPGWNAPTIANDAGMISSMSTHCLIGNGVPEDTPVEKVYRSLVAFPIWCEGDFLGMLKQMADGGVSDPKIALTEMMIFTQHRGQPGCRSLTEVPFYAGMLNMGIRLDGRLELITRTAVANHGAGLRKELEHVFADPAYYANRLYSTQSGRWPVHLRIVGPHFQTEELPSLPAVPDGSYLDAVALLDDSGKELNLLVTNRHPTSALETKIALKDFAPERGVRAKDVSGPDYMAGNSFEHPDAVTLKEKKLEAGPDGLTYSFPPSSLTCLTFHRR